MSTTGGHPSALARIQIASLFIEAALYGIYLTTFFRALTFILRRRDPAHPNAGQWFILFGTCFLWSNATLNLALGLNRQLNGETIGVHIAKTFLLWLHFAVADMMMIYRCWKIYDNSFKVAILPVVLWLGGVFASCFWMLYLALHGRFASSKVSCVFWTFSVAVNVYSTVGIVYRVATFNKAFVNAMSQLRESSSQVRDLRRRTTSTKKEVISIIIESALMYTSVSIAVLVTIAAAPESNFLYLATAGDVIMVGISFDLILIRINQQLAKDMSEYGVPISALKFEAAYPNSERSEADVMESRDGGRSNCPARAVSDEQV